MPCHRSRRHFKKKKSWLCQMPQCTLRSITQALESEDPCAHSGPVAHRLDGWEPSRCITEHPLPGVSTRPAFELGGKDNEQRQSSQHKDRTQEII